MLAGRAEALLIRTECSARRVLPIHAVSELDEVRKKSTKDVEQLRPLQESLLDSAITSTRPGGVVAYVTCSPHPDETRAVVDAVLGRRDDATIEDARPLFPGVPDLGDGPDVQLWPHLHGTDAMYLALIRRS